ncbi:surface-adhesin E family protein [Nitrospira sp. KM1]|uniref:surface-adhesin E family protein n=1 Tax=Nitrospira sp. KM1 TaxID=1936990 RepID=UPI00351A01F9
MLSAEGVYIFLPRSLILGMLVGVALLPTTPAHGEWKAVSTGTDHTTVYSDPETVLRIKGHVTVWQLLDFQRTQTVGGKPYLSVKLHNEFDCEGKLTRVLEITHFSGNMGSGRVVSTTSDNQQWVRVIPNTLASMALATYCNEGIKEPPHS